MLAERIQTRLYNFGCAKAEAPYLDSEMWAFAQSANRSHPKKRIDPSFTRIYPKTTKVRAQCVQEHLPDLLTAIDTGEEVELTRPG